MESIEEEVEGRQSPEMYLKTIYTLRQEKGYCRSVDVANQLNVSKPSVSVAVGKLKDMGYVFSDRDGTLELTDKGKERAQIVYEKFEFWVEILKKLGLKEDDARGEAGRFEHALSDRGFETIKDYIRSIKAACPNGSAVKESRDCCVCPILPWNPCEKS